MFSSLLAKIICIVSILCSNSVAGLFTFFKIRKKCSKYERSQRLTYYLSIATCFSVGIFLAICFLSLYNSASKKIMMIQSILTDTNVFKNYPLSETLLCLGLFCLWFLEWLGHTCVQKVFTSYGMDANSDRVKQVHELCSRNITEPNGTDDATEDNVNLLQSEGSIDSVPTYESRANCIRYDLKGINDVEKNSLLKSIMLTCAMFLHTFLEAIGFGLLDNSNQVFGMAFAMFLHQLLCSSTLGLRLARNSIKNIKLWHAVLLLILYLLALPIGGTIGVVLHHHSAQSMYNLTSADGKPSEENNSHITGHLMVGIVQNFAAAAFVYIVFMEMLPKEINAGMPDSKQSGTRTTRRGAVCCLMGLLGFSFIAVIRLISMKGH